MRTVFLTTSLLLTACETSRTPSPTPADEPQTFTVSALTVAVDFDTPKRPRLRIATPPADLERLEVFHDATRLGSTTGPFELTLDTTRLPDGLQKLELRGTHRGHGRSVTLVAVAVDNTPPLARLTVTGANPFTLLATASDAHPLVNADFLVDDVVFQSGPSLTASWEAVDANDHTLTVRVRDSFGNVGSATRSAPHAAATGTPAHFVSVR